MFYHSENAMLVNLDEVCFFTLERISDDCVPSLDGQYAVFVELKNGRKKRISGCYESEENAWDHFLEISDSVNAIK